MPQPQHLLLFLSVAAMIVVLPGPDFVLVTRNTLAGGRRAGVATAAGSVLGISCYAALAAAGLTVLIAANDTVLLALRLAGACYLVYLGTTALVRLWRAWRSAPTGGPGEQDAAARGGSPFWQGLLNNALNPKALAFFLSVMPQFVTPGAGAAAQTALLGGIVVAVAAAWWTVYILTITRLSELLRRRRVRQGVELTSGVALTAFGVALAVAA